MAVNFFVEEVSFTLKNKRKRKEWLIELASLEHHSISVLNYIFCSDEYLLKMNVEYLDHDTYTDIITFDNSEVESIIEGDVFVSIERVKENSLSLNIEQEKELSRVISHGLFHLLGYTDKTEEDSAIMRTKEDFAISLYEKNKCST